MWGKRLFDLFCSSVLMIVLLPLLCYYAYLIWREGEGPIFYISERMKSPTKSFGMLKFRTMRTSDGLESGVTGSDKAGRINALGQRMRAKRLDELPQLWNVMKGDLSFVGPRPPLREYVDRFPEIYGQVLQNKPGITGLATLEYHRHEAALLEPCKTASETDLVYTRRCIPTKARLDLIYQRNWSTCFDCWIIYETLRRVYLGRGS